MAERMQTQCRTLRRERAWRLAALVLVVAVAGLGCNPIATLGFLAGAWGNENVPARCPLTLDDKESKVAIICFHTNNVASNPAFHDADRFVSQLLANALTHRYKENNDNVKLVSATKVDKYLREHPDFISLSKQDIGKFLDADLLVFLELGPMTMYAPSSNNTLYHGSVEIRIGVYDAHEPDGEGLKYPEDTCVSVYPPTEWEDANSMKPADFRANFLKQVAKDLVPFFAPCPPPDRKDMERGGMSRQSFGS